VSARGEPLPEFARRIEREWGEAARATEVGLRVLHAELVEQRSPQRSIGVRITAAEIAAEAEADEPEAGL
jgi:hypothetical protein